MKKRNLIMISLIVISSIIAFVAIPVAISALSSQIGFSASGTMKTVGCSAFTDPDATIPLTNIEWGILEPAETIDKIIYFKVTGNSPATLSMMTENWVPPIAETEINTSWDYDGTAIQPDEVRAITLTLTVSASATISEFDFDYIIIASG